MPLNLLRILLSIPWGNLQEVCQRISLGETYGDSLVLVGGEAVGVLLLLLDDLGLVQGLDCHLFIFNKETRSSLRYIFSIHLIFSNIPVLI